MYLVTITLDYTLLFSSDNDLESDTEAKNLFMLQNILVFIFVIFIQSPELICRHFSTLTF